jgi:uncharacterized protein (DUF608 family)
MYYRSLLAFIFSTLLILTGRTQSLDASHYVPVKKPLNDDWRKSLWSDERKVYSGDELKTIGMPCGGIAAGQLYVTGDGTLANWWIANNAYNTGYGIDWLMNFNTPLGPWKVCYQTFEPFKYISQGFTILIKQNGKEIKKNLDKKDFDDISFVGEYPVAKINYASRTTPLPLKIDATVYSPFIPLNAKESATPATILNYTLQNTGNDELVVSLNGWLQNMVCLELKDEAKGISRNRIFQSQDMTSLFMDLVPDKSFAPALRKSTVIEDFESGNFDTWKVEGTAFGEAPVDGNRKAGDQSDVTGYKGTYLINSYASANGDEATGKLVSKPFKITEDYIIFKIGGGSHNNKTCVNLLVNNKVVRTATGENSETLKDAGWNVQEFKGKQAVIEIIDAEKGGWGHINIDNIAQSNLPAKEFYFPGNHPYFGNASLSFLGAAGKGDANTANTVNEAIAEQPLGKPLPGSVGTEIKLKPGEKKDLTFVVSWYFPNRPMQYGDGGNWNRPIPADGPAIGNMYANWYGNSLDVARWLKENYKRLNEATFAFHNAYYNNSSLPYWLKQRIMMPVSTLATETCQWWANDKFWAWEGVGSCVGTCTHVWNYEQALAHLFPELEKNIREKTDFGTSLQEDGGIQARNGWGGILIDGHAGAILKAYREHLHSKDNLFLSRNWNKIKKATLFIISEDENEDGLIEKKQANTYDIAFYGANTYVGSLYLSALKAASKMAAIMDDTAFSKKCNTIFESGSKLSVEKLWKGEYFIQDVDLKKHSQYQYGPGCLSDQLFGQTWAHLYGLGYIYPERHVKKALQSIWTYNWAPAVGAQTKNHKPERTYADFDEPGLLVATWPFNKHMGEDGVRYRDEVWTGIEYQVATNMIYEGMIDEGLSLVKAVHERYNPVKHNPWNEIECGDHYARALASWGVLVALQGYQYNGPEKEFAINPVQKENYRGFFTSAESWGNFSREISGDAITDRIIVEYGRLPMKKLKLPMQSQPKSVTINHRNSARAVSFVHEDNFVVLNLEELTIDKDQPLIVKTIIN